MNAMAALKPVDQRGLDEATLTRSILEKLIYAVGRDPARAVNRDWGVALSLAVRDGIIDCWMSSTRQTYEGWPQAGLLPVDGVSDRAPAA